MGQKGSEKIDCLFDEMHEAVGHLLSSKDNAMGLIWGVDNSTGTTQDEWNWISPLSDIYPLTTLDFEGRECFAPNNYERILTKEFGDYLSLPKDINSHYQHISENDMETTQNELRKLIDE